VIRGNPTNRRRGSMLVAIFAALALLLAACGSDDDDNGADEPPATEVDPGDDIGGDDDDGDDVGDDDDDDDGDVGGEGGSIHFGWIPWDEDIAVTHLWKVLLEERGYDVEMTQLDAAPLFQGLADGELDVFLDAWLPDTHADYWEEHEDELTELSTWYDEATLNIAVPEYVDDIDTIADLEGEGDRFDNRIVGIEPGAGIMRLTEDEVMPGYGLEDDYELLEGGTPAMLTELETALDNEEDIVVTLWHPHWAYSAFPIKDLDDVDSHFGEGEEILGVANNDWADDNAEAVEWLSNFELTDDELGELEDLVLNTYEDDEEEGVKVWLEDNQDVVDAWFE